MTPAADRRVGWRKAWSRVRQARGALAPLAAGGVAWGALAAGGVEARAAAHAGGLFASAGLALSPWRGQAERVILATLSVLHLGLASTAPRDPLFLVLLCAYAVLLCRALIELDRHHGRGIAREVPPPVGWRTQVGLTGAVLGVALVLFAIVPRPSMPIEIRFHEGPISASTPSRPSGSGVSGLDESPSLHEGLNVALDPAVVAEVRVLDEAGNGVRPRVPLRLRGRCFDEYRDGQWKRTTTDAPRDAANGVVALGAVPTEGRTRLDHEVRLFGLRTRAILAFPEVETVTAARVWTDGGGNLSFDRETEGETRYRALSWGLPRQPRGVDSVPIPVDEEMRRLPPGLEFLARVAQQHAGGDPTPWGKAKRIEEFLETEFEYTLSTPPPEPGRDPVVDFLYRGSGYCVHFASAMALMLRSQGVPARLASGYMVREWEEEGRRFLVRNWDAHAWVEVPFPGIGWVAFDPSPIEGTVGPTAADGAPLPPPPSARAEGVLVRVQGAMAGFGGEAQARAWGGLLSRAGRWWPAGTVVLGAIAWIVWRRGRRAELLASGAGAKRPRGAGFYDEFVRRAGRRGIRPAPGATPFEFAERVERELPGLDARGLVRLYYEVRYGERALDAEETVAVRSTLEELTSRRSPSEDRRGSRR